MDFVQDGVWDRNKLESIFPRDVYDCITSQVSPSHSSLLNRLFWMATPSGKFTIPSVIESLTNLNYVDDTQVPDKRALWQTIWSWKGPSRVKMHM